MAPVVPKFWFGSFKTAKTFGLSQLHNRHVPDFIKILGVKNIWAVLESLCVK